MVTLAGHAELANYKENRQCAKRRLTTQNSEILLIGEYLETPNLFQIPPQIVHAGGFHAVRMGVVNFRKSLLQKGQSDYIPA